MAFIMGSESPIYLFIKIRRNSSSGLGVKILQRVRITNTHLEY